MLWTTTMIPIPHIDWTLKFACSHHNDDTQYLSARREDGDGLALGIEWSRADGQRVYRKD